MNVLASRVSDAGKANTSLKGKVFVNGTIRNDDSFRRISAYLLQVNTQYLRSIECADFRSFLCQDDRLYAHLTVFETLLLAAHFYLPTAVSIEDKEALVTDIIEELGLVLIVDQNEATHNRGGHLY